MESDAFRRDFLRWVADQRGLDWMPGEESFAAAREMRLDRLGDLVAESINREALLRLIDEGQPSGLPFVSGRLSAISSRQTVIGDVSSATASPQTHGGVASYVPSDGWSMPSCGEEAQKLQADG
jgi:adenosylcobyric acid synthase